MSPVRECGCQTAEGHVEPYVDPILHIQHGERDALNGDPLPHEVPGTGGLDAYCLCGHPGYLSCAESSGGGSIWGLTLHDVGGYFITTLS